MTAEFGGLVLAGGRSTRMGANKALLEVEPGGPKLIEVVIERIVAAGAGEVLICANNAELYESLGREIVPDAVSGIGPLGGILGGLRASSYVRCFVVACDMPDLDPLLINYLANCADSHQAVVPRWRDPSGDERIETLHAIYSKAAVPIIRREIERGERSIYRCLAALDVRYVEEEELVRYPSFPRVFRNINRPPDWQS